MKTKSMMDLENKMQGLEQNSMRYHILDSAKNFKASWIELGRALYSVAKDKMYKQWDYSSFDIYVAKEVGIKKQTAMKLLRSYYFLEKEEPLYLKEDYLANSEAKVIPSYESVDVLRRAKNKKELDEDDYAALKKEVFQNGKDYTEVRKGLSSLIKQREEMAPEEVREKRKIATVRRFLGTLKAIKREIETAKLVSAAVIKEAEHLIKKLEEEIGV